MDPLDLPEDAGRILTGLARSVIAADLGVAVTPPEEPAWLARRGASFVTLTRAGVLRGCIGSTSAVRPLGDDVRINARGAAFRDPRFLPLQRRELAATEIEVSVLSASTPITWRNEADAVRQLRPGIDGLVLEYAGRRATFLPQVWAKLPGPADFLSGLKRKLGLPATFWADDVRLSRYVVRAFHEPNHQALPEEQS
ncbi:MAG: AmmeMemoRadiSam system protein A [Nocardioides sp.]